MKRRSLFQLLLAPLLARVLPTPSPTSTTNCLGLEQFITANVWNVELPLTETMLIEALRASKLVLDTDAMQHRTPEELPGEDDAPIDEDGAPAKKEREEDESPNSVERERGRGCAHGYTIASTGEWTGFLEAWHGGGAGLRVFHRLLAACCPECPHLPDGSNPQPGHGQAEV